MLLHRREGGDRLERGAGRIEAGRGPVQGRIVGVLGGLLVEQQLQLLPLAGVDEDLGIERRVRSHRADRPVAWVEGHDRTGIRVPALLVDGEVDPVHERGLRGPLQIRVEGQLEAVARDRVGLCQGRARRPTERIDSPASQARLSAQELVEGGFDTALPDPVARQVSALPLELLGRDLADMTEELGREVAEGITADECVHDGDTRELGFPLPEELHLGLAGVLLHGDRGARGALVLLDLLSDVPERDAQDMRQPLQLAVGPVVGEVRRADADRGRARVVDDHPVVPVADRPSRSLDPFRAELVVLGGLEVLCPGQDLQRPQAEEEDGKGDDHEEAEDPDPKDHLRRQPIRRPGARVRRQETAGSKACASASQRTPPVAVERPARRACDTGRRPGTPGSGSARPRAAALRRARPSRTRGHRA